MAGGIDPIEALIAVGVVSREQANAAASMNARTRVGKLIAAGVDAGDLLPALAQFAGMAAAPSGALITAEPVGLPPAIANELRALLACPIRRDAGGVLEIAVAEPDTRQHLAHLGLGEHRALLADERDIVAEMDRLLPGQNVEMAITHEVNDQLGMARNASVVDDRQANPFESGLDLASQPPVPLDIAAASGRQDLSLDDGAPVVDEPAPPAAPAIQIVPMRAAPVAPPVQELPAISIVPLPAAPPVAALVPPVQELPAISIVPLPASPPVEEPALAVAPAMAPAMRPSEDSGRIVDENRIDRIAKPREHRPRPAPAPAPPPAPAPAPSASLEVAAPKPAAVDRDGRLPPKPPIAPPPNPLLAQRRGPPIGLIAGVGALIALGVGAAIAYPKLMGAEKPAGAAVDPVLEKQKQLLAKGNGDLARSDWGYAIASYTTVIDLGPQSELALEARMGRAQAFANNDGLADAKSDLRAVIALTPVGHSLRVKATEMLEKLEMPIAPPDAGVGSTGSVEAKPDAPGSAKTDGAKPDGVKPDGVKPDGAKPDGVKPDGVKPDGAKPDGAKPDAPPAPKPKPKQDPPKPAQPPEELPPSGSGDPEAAKKKLEGVNLD